MFVLRMIRISYCTQTSLCVPSKTMATERGCETEGVIIICIPEGVALLHISHIVKLNTTSANINYI